MRRLLFVLLALSFIQMYKPLVASSHDDDNVAAPAVVTVSRAPVLNPNDAFSRFPTHVLRQIGDIFLENDFQSFGRFLQVSRTTNTLKDQIFHTTQTMGTKTISGKERTAMHYAGANNTKDRILELLGRQTGNPELFKKDHARDYQNWSKTDLLKLLKNKTLKGALDVNTSEGKAYFTLKEQLKDPSLQSLSFYYKGLRLCPNLKEATHLVTLDLSYNELTTFPRLNTLINLVALDLSSNQLILPPAVTGLMSLEALNLSRNQLIAAPVVTGLMSLEGLYLHCNQLAAAPVVTGLPNLQILDLADNQLNAPPSVTGLPNLQRLYLDPNLCGDQTLLETLRGLNRSRNDDSKIGLYTISKDAQGNTVETRVSLN